MTPTTKAVRVLIVDDSSVVRKLLTSALTAHPEIEVVGTAANGILGLAKVMQLEPEAVILDIEMPEMDGIATLTKLRKTHPRLPVIMFSTLTQRGADVTFDALAAGASDYVLKPSTQNGETLEGVVSSSLVPKLLALARSRPSAPGKSEGTVGALERNVFEARAASKQMAGLSAKPAALAGPALGSAPPTGTKPMLRPEASRFPSRPSVNLQVPAGLRPDPGALAKSVKASMPHASQPVVGGPAFQALLRKQIQIIVIASSTGGPNALAEVLPRLPKQLPVPIVLVQHMPPIFTRCLAERLNLRSELDVLESAGGELLRAGSIYIAPGNRHLELQRAPDGVRTLLSDGPQENSCRPAADVLFRSAARCYGAGVLAVVLTGMGQDGARGAREIRDAGGRVLVQSGPTCVVWGMPKAVEDSGLAEAVVPLSEMAAAILQRVALGLHPLRLREDDP